MAKMTYTPVRLEKEDFNNVVALASLEERKLPDMIRVLIKAGLRVRTVDNKK
jgi:hypothetical protein